MLDKNIAFEEAILHFPRWMDIRKRKSKSEGGKLLRSITDEIGALQMAQEDYRKEFFIIHYIGRESSVIDYLFSSTIGGTETDEVSLLFPSIQVTKDLKKFLSSEDKAFYGEGQLMLRKAPEEGNKIRYAVNGYSYDAVIEKVHIWNIFDEFALFSGIERYPDEKNDALARRSLMAFKRRTNSTEAGLKNVILNALEGIDEVEAEEISIAKVSEEDLFEKDEDFGQVIEKLAQLNRDTFRTKVWDKSRWEHEFRKLSYAAIPWDKEVVEIQDGVVGEDSLKADFLSEIENAEGADISIDLYEKSEATVSNYIRNRRVESAIDLKLKKYQNVIKPVDIEYKITAEPAIELGEHDIYIDAHRISSGEKDYYASELVINKDEVKPYTVQRGLVEAGKRYRLKFYPTNEYGTMEISRANVIRANGIESLLLPKGSYGFDKSNQFSNLNVKLHSSALSTFSKYENLTKTDRGIGLLNAAENGYGVIDVSDFGGQYVKVEADVQETSITHNPSLVQIEGNLELTSDNRIVSTGRSGTIRITARCNQLSYRMATGNCIVTKTINGIESPSEIWFDEKTESLKFDEETDVVVVIQKMNNNIPLVIDNIRYARFAVSFRLESKELIRTPMGSIIPNLNGNKENLIIEIKTFTGMSPIIKFVHIGASLKNAEYVTEYFDGGIDSKLDIETNCEVALETYDLSGTLTSETRPYISKDMYTNASAGEAVYLEIDTSRFSNLKRTTPALEKFSYQGRLSSWMRLQPGESLDTIRIDGDVKVMVSRTRINDVLKDTPSDKIYSCRKLKGFVVKSGNEESLKTITSDDLGASADAYSVHNLPIGMRAAFVVDSLANIENLGINHDRAFESLYIISSAQEHIAYNRARMIKEEISDLNIVDMFTPLVPANKAMIYSLEPGGFESGTFVRFMHDDGLKSWSVGKKNINVSTNIDHQSSSNYQTESIELRKKVILGNSMDLEEEQLVGQRILNLGEYIVTPPENMDIIHETREKTGEVLYAQEDGFNKLQYSNVIRITSIKRENGSIVSPLDYTLIEDAGIISWKNPLLYGQKITIGYQYGLPRFLVFTNLDKLYEVVGYNIDAYKFKETLEMMNVKKDTILSDVEAQKIRSADRIITRSSNPNYIVRVDGSIVRLSKINEEDRVVVKNGYLYQGGQEYFRYTNRSENFLENMGSVELVDTTRTQGELITNHSASNFVPDSIMAPQRMATLSILDAKKDPLKIGSGKTGRIGACDDYNYWRSLEMDLSFVDGFRGKATRFKTTKEYGFSMMDITHLIEDGSIISMHVTGTVETSIAVSDMMIEKERIVSKPSLEEHQMRKLGSFRSFEIAEKEDKKYFLVIRGDGTVDDIIVSKDQPNLDERHKSAMDRLGLSILEKKITAPVRGLLFDSRGNDMDGVEVDREGLLRTASSLSWGLTKLFELRSSWKNLSMRYGRPVMDRYFVLEENEGYIETEALYLRSSRSVKQMLISVNELAQGKMKGFSISVYTSDRSSGGFRLVNSEDNTNFIQIAGEKLSEYFKVRVSGEKGKIISSLGAYAEYVENSTTLRVGDVGTGTLISKVYDLGESAEIKVLGIEGEEIEAPEKIKLSVRARRKSSEEAVWTDWKEVEMDEELKAIKSPSFNGYEFVQYKILMDTPARIKIKKINLEVK